MPRGNATCISAVEFNKLRAKCGVVPLVYMLVKMRL